MDKPFIMVLDSQGGGLGKAIIERFREKAPELEVIAVGTNSIASMAMLKAGAKAAATGENAVIYNAGQADIIIGGIGIIAANAMMGEISPGMALAVSSSKAVKLLIPQNKCNLRVAGVSGSTMAQRVEEVVKSALEIIGIGSETADHRSALQGNR